MQRSKVSPTKKSMTLHVYVYINVRHCDDQNIVYMSNNRYPADIS